jgi:hypothetical protein
MSLDVRKLEKVRELADAVIQARCPACAEGGHDRKGEHLRIFPDGRFGCCVNTKDREHRKRIFALAGDRTPGRLTVRVAAATSKPPATSVKASLAASFGTLGTVVSMSRACAREDSSNNIEGLKDFELAVPSVPECSHPADERLPYLTAGGTLVILFASPERYHWWKGGQSVAETLNEVRAGLAPNERMNHAATV